MASPGPVALPRGSCRCSPWPSPGDRGVSVTGLLVEPVLLALRRDPAALADGQLWRLLTALLVQDGGVPGTVFNLLGLLRWASRPSAGWAARLGAGYLAGGLTGELVGWAGWQPIGAGNSVGVCGLAGALAVALLRARTTRRAGWPRSPRPPGRPP